MFLYFSTALNYALLAVVQCLFMHNLRMEAVDFLLERDI